MARGRKSAWSDWAGDWQDRVADKDDPLEAGCPDIDVIVGDAIEVARTVAECTLEPLREIIAALPAMIDAEAWSGGRRWRRHGRFGRRRSWRAGVSWDA